MSVTLTTNRLRLRPWRPEDLEPFAALNADPEVMRHFPHALDRSQTEALMQRINDHFKHHGFGLWAVEVVGGEPFIGFVGLNTPSFQAHFTPCIEVGWRLARHAWGFGFATEAARAAMRFGYRELGRDEIVSFTVPANERSRCVMTRLEMTHDPADDFDHPLLPESHALRRHVLYRKKKCAERY